MTTLAARLYDVSKQSVVDVYRRWELSQKVLRIAGFIIPVIPLWRTIRDQNKRFFTFIERPLMGIPSDFIGTAASRAIAGTLLGVVSPVSFWRNFCEIYLSYQSANVIRNGVNVDERLTDKAKIRLNYWYSVVAYSVFTTANKLGQAAVAEVCYAMLWPLLSQSAATYIITPVMFGKFAKKDFIDTLRSSTVSANLVNQELQVEVQRLDGIIAAEPDNVNARRARCELRWKMRWFHFFRNGLENSAPTPVFRFFTYWTFKTIVSVAMSVIMIVFYFTTRFLLVGFGDHLGPLSKMVHFVFGALSQ